MAGRKACAPGYRQNGTIDWRSGGIRHDRPTTYQARTNGPPLLFATDARMSILVTLALSPVPYRTSSLQRAVGYQNVFYTVDSLVSAGIVASWEGRSGARYLALDPCHPCYEGLVVLLRRIGERFGFPQPLYLSDALLAGAAPRRTSRKRDTRMLFGSPMRTLLLLAVYLLRRSSINEVYRSLAIFDRKSVGSCLFRYAAFGVLNRMDVGGSRGIFFEMNPDYEFAFELTAIVEQVSKILAVWSLKIRQYDANGRPKSGDRRKKVSRPTSARDQSFRRWAKTSLLPLSLD